MLHTCCIFAAYGKQNLKSKHYKNLLLLPNVVISNFGELNLPGNKATLIHEILTTCHNAPDGLEEYSSKAVKIIDGGRIPYQFVGKPSRAFRKYAETIFKVLLTYFTFFKRIDIVFDVYLPNSLKAATREKRGRRVRKRVQLETNVLVTGCNSLNTL